MLRTGLPSKGFNNPNRHAGGAKISHGIISCEVFIFLHPLFLPGQSLMK
jgi:hypothetical protein